MILSGRSSHNFASRCSINYALSAVGARFTIQAFSMARANKINATAMSANRAKVCILFALDLPG